MEINFVILLLSALVPLLIGFIWYHPKVFGELWMKVADITDEKMKSGNMALIFGLTLVFSFFIAFVLQFLVIHQYSVYSILANETGINDPNSEIGSMLKMFLDKYGNNFRTFKHGAFHGFLGALFFATPVLGINALFERKSFKYIFVHAGYWALTLSLMGGIICAYA
jgi:hypothetical protein